MISRTTFPGKFTLVTGPRAVQTGTTVSGSAAVVLSDTSLLQGAVGVTGTGIPPGTYVRTIDSATGVTLTANATASGSASLTFALEPVTLADAKAHLRVDFADDDALIAVLIAAARQRCESEIDRAFLTSTWDYTVEAFPSYEVRNDPAMWRRVSNVLEIPKAPLASVTSLTYVAADGTTPTLVQGTDFLVRTGDPGAVYPFPVTSIWPYTRLQLDAVTVRVVLGYGGPSAVPAPLKAAILLLVGHLYEHREAVNEGAVAELPLGVGYLLAGVSWGCRP